MINTSIINKKLLRVFLLSLLILAGCTKDREEPKNTGKTMEPIFEVNESQTASITELSEIRPESTQTTLPTYQPISQEKLKKWLAEKITRPKCSLPCFWGITPGETGIQEAYQILAPYATKTETLYSANQFLFYFDIIPSAYDDPIMYLEIGFGELDEKVHDLFFSDLSNYASYSIKSILAEYGPPKEIWMGAWSPDPGWDKEPRGTTFILYYQNQQFLLRYSQPPDNGKIVDDSMISCFDNGPSIRAWSNENIEMEDEIIRKRYLLSDVRPFLSLEELTGISPEDFYDSFVNISGDVCVETPLDTWLASKSGEFD